MDDKSGLMVGRDPHTAKRLLALAGVVFVAAFLVVTPADVLGVELPFAPNLWTSLVLLAALPVFAAFVNDGVLVSVALAAAPWFGFYLPLTLFDMGYPSESVVWGIGTASMFALPFGLLGFAVGAGARRLMAHAGWHL